MAAFTVPMPPVGTALDASMDGLRAEIDRRLNGPFIPVLRELAKREVTSVAFYFEESLLERQSLGKLIEWVRTALAPDFAMLFPLTFVDDVAGHGVVTRPDYAITPAGEASFRAPTHVVTVSTREWRFKGFSVPVSVAVDELAFTDGGAIGARARLEALRKIMQASESLNLTIVRVACELIFRTPLLQNTARLLMNQGEQSDTIARALAYLRENHNILGTGAQTARLKHVAEQRLRRMGVQTVTHFIGPQIDGLRLMRRPAKSDRSLVGPGFAAARAPRSVTSSHDLSTTVDGVTFVTPPGAGVGEGTSASMPFAANGLTGSYAPMREPTLGGDPRAYQSPDTVVGLYDLTARAVVNIRKVDALRAALPFLDGDKDKTIAYLVQCGDKYDTVRRKTNLAETSENARDFHPLLYWGWAAEPTFLVVVNLGDVDVRAVSPDMYMRLREIAKHRAWKHAAIATAEAALRTADAALDAADPANAAAFAAARAGVAAARGGRYAEPVDLFAAYNAFFSGMPTAAASTREVDDGLGNVVKVDDTNTLRKAMAARKDMIDNYLLEMDMLNVKTFQWLYDENIPIPLGVTLMRLGEGFLYSRWVGVGGTFGSIETASYTSQTEANKVFVFNTLTDSLAVVDPGKITIVQAGSIGYLGGGGTQFKLSGWSPVAQRKFNAPPLPSPMRESVFVPSVDSRRDVLVLLHTWNTSMARPEDFPAAFDARGRWERRVFEAVLPPEHLPRRFADKPVDALLYPGLGEYIGQFPDIFVESPRLNAEQERDRTADDLWKSDVNFLVSRVTARYADGLHEGCHFNGRLWEGCMEGLLGERLPFPVTHPVRHPPKRRRVEQAVY